MVQRDPCVPRSACIIVLFNLPVANFPLVVSELARFSWDLKHADITSITQMMELAKLAVVTFQDEDDGIEHTATAGDLSNDTDATLVKDALLHVGTIMSPEFTGKLCSP